MQQLLTLSRVAATACKRALASLRASLLSHCSRHLAVAKHYPRSHAYLLGGLGVSLLILIALPSESSNAGPAISTVSIPLTLDAPAAQIESVSRLESLEGLEGLEGLKSLDASPANEPSLPPAQPAPVASPWQDYEIASGDSLSVVFSKAGLDDGDLFQLINSSAEAKVLNRVYPGYKLSFNIPEGGELEQLRVLKTPLEGYLFTRSGQSYTVEPIIKTPEIRQAFKVGTISDSLFLAGQREQIPATTLMEMANIFGGVIDFILDPRTGDEFSILYEEKYLDGEYIGQGDILASRFINQGRVFTAVRFIDAEGEIGYYNPEGESMRKAFLRSPLDVFRISSNFNPRRRHPVLNTIRAHKGTDYAAPTGTPIRATSDGRISFAGRKGSFGNLVIVKHSGGFETKYAHLNKFGSFKKGARVRQGDIIGTVGSTGSATGPHLHYEFLVNGVHQNPRTIVDKLPKAQSVDPAQLPAFREQASSLLELFDAHTRQQGQPLFLTRAD